MCTHWVPPARREVKLSFHLFQCMKAYLSMPVATSASQFAYASFRMEPQSKIARHAAGVAAAMAVPGKTSVHDVNVRVSRTLPAPTYGTIPVTARSTNVCFTRSVLAQVA